MSNEDSNLSFKVTDRRSSNASSDPEAAAPEASAKVEEAQGAHPHNAPPLDFVTLILSLREGALVALGLVSNEELGDMPADFSAARYQIEMLSLLEEKTKGNLTPDEAKLLSTVIYELRVAFVEARKLAGRS